jgi:hypothetical protein
MLTDRVGKLNIYSLVEPVVPTYWSIANLVVNAVQGNWLHATLLGITSSYQFQARTM